jgi:hypothetical protein
VGRGRRDQAAGAAFEPEELDVAEPEDPEELADSEDPDELALAEAASFFGAPSFFPPSFFAPSELEPEPLAAARESVR